MLTVLCIHRATGRQVLREADRVEFQGDPGKKERPGAGLLVCRDDLGTSEQFPLSEREEDNRDVFVMNAFGQTVARYTL